MATEVLVYHDKQQWNEAFDRMRKHGDKLQRKATRFSQPEQRIVPSADNSEIALDSKGRIVYDTVFYITYPVTEFKRRKNGKRDQDRNGNKASSNPSGTGDSIQEADELRTADSSPVERGAAARD